MLGHPGVDRVTVDAALAIVADEVLDVGVNACLVCAGHSVAADDAGQQAVLRIILVVTSIEGAAVHIGGRGIPAGVTVLECLGADGAAFLLGKVCIPGLGQRAGAGETGASTHAGEAADLGRAVSVFAFLLTDTLQLGQTAVSVDVQVFHLVNGQFVQQSVPLGVVEVGTKLQAKLGDLTVVLNFHAVLCAGGDSL